MINCREIENVQRKARCKKSVYRNMNHNMSRKIKDQLRIALDINGQNCNVENTDIIKRFCNMANYIGLSNVEGIEILNLISAEIMSGSEIASIEDRLKNIIKQKSLTRIIDEKLDNRAKKIYSQIKKWLYGEYILDIGAGDGRIASEISNNLNRKMYLVDIIDYSIGNLPFSICDGYNMPYSDDRFDTSLMITTLHHTENPISVFCEALRVTKKRVIIIESIHYNDHERKTNLFFDWLCNRFDGKVNIPFNFKTPIEWYHIFEKNGAEIIYETDLGFDQPLIPERHWFYALDKKEEEI